MRSVEQQPPGAVAIHPDTTWVPVSGEPGRSMNAPDGSGLRITDPRYARYAKEVGYA